MTVDNQVKGKTGLRWGPICLGTFVIGSVTFSVATFTGWMANLQLRSETTQALVQVGTAIICYMIGGLVVGVGTRYRGALHGLLSEEIASVVCVIIYLVWNTILRWD